MESRSWGAEAAEVVSGDVELGRVEFSKSMERWRAAPPYLLAVVRARDAFGAAKMEKVGF
jgi:hypothetical protein